MLCFELMFEYGSYFARIFDVRFEVTVLHEGKHNKWLVTLERYANQRQDVCVIEVAHHHCFFEKRSDLLHSVLSA